MATVIRRKDKRLQLIADLVVSTNRISKAIDFENAWLKIKDGIITVKAPFDWNGCTWSRDGKCDADGVPYSWIASCLHDALCVAKIPGVSINDKNLIFYDELCKIHFKWLGVPACTAYYLGVTLSTPYIKTREVN